MSEETPPPPPPKNEDSLFKVPFLPNKKRTASQGPGKKDTLSSQLPRGRSADVRTKRKKLYLMKPNGVVQQFNLRIIDDIRNYQIEFEVEPVVDPYDDSQPGPSNRIYPQNARFMIPREDLRERVVSPVNEAVVEEVEEEEEEDVDSDGDCDEELAAVVANLTQKCQAQKLESDVVVQPSPVVAQQIQEIIAAAAKPHQHSIDSILGNTPKANQENNKPAMCEVPEYVIENGIMTRRTVLVPKERAFPSGNGESQVPPPIDYNWVPPDDNCPIRIPQAAWDLYEANKAEHERLQREQEEK
uniref:PPP1R35_C domain-containing protein n=1 Tax=Caenorhabditis tropicalis TaxID=1561998 RepID=A0A1I7TN75_9PELO